MLALGIPAEVIELTDGATSADAGGHVASLGPADLATLAHSVQKAAGAAPAP